MIKGFAVNWPMVLKMSTLTALNQRKLLTSIYFVKEIVKDHIEGTEDFMQKMKEFE